MRDNRSGISASLDDVVDELEDGRLFARLQIVDLTEQLANVDPFLVGRENLDDRRLGDVVLGEQIDAAG